MSGPNAHDRRLVRAFATPRDSIGVVTMTIQPHGFAGRCLLVAWPSCGGLGSETAPESTRNVVTFAVSAGLEVGHRNYPNYKPVALLAMRRICVASPHYFTWVDDL